MFNLSRNKFARQESFVRRNYWGVVYDASTKQPLKRAIVRIFGAKSHRLIRTAVSDALGAFSIQLPPGNYIVEVSLKDYLFPSTSVVGDEDPPWTNIYLGDELKLKQDEALDIAIPLDPMNLSPFRKIWLRVRARLWTLVLRANLIWLVIGFIYSILGMIKWWGSFAGMIQFLGYVSFFILRYMQQRLLPKEYGTVYDEDYIPVPDIPIGVYDTEFDQLVGKTFTNKSGHYNITTAPQLLRLRVMDAEWKMQVQNKTVDFISITPPLGSGKSMVITTDITVKKR